MNCETEIRKYGGTDERYEHIELLNNKDIQNNIKGIQSLTLDNIENTTKENINQIPDDNLQLMIPSINLQTSKTYENMILEHILQDSEYLKQYLSKMSPEEQLKMMLEMYNDKQYNDPVFLLKLQDHYCFASTILYKMLVFIGISESTANAFSRDYMDYKLSLQESGLYKQLMGTYSFLNDWLSVLVLIVFEWFIYIYINGWLKQLTRFFSEHTSIITDITNLFSSFGAAFNEIISKINKNLTDLSLVSWLTSFVEMTFNSWDEVRIGLTTGDIYINFKYYGLLVLMLTGGVAIVIWAFYIITATLSESDEITKFCKEKFHVQ